MTGPPNLVQEEQPAEAARQWLSDKPFEWSPALATRAALRVLPWGLGRGSSFWVDRYTLPLMHSLFVAWSTFTAPIRGHKLAAELTTNLLYPAAMFHEKEAYFASAMRNIAAAISAKEKLNKVDHSVRAMVALNNLVQTLGDEGVPADFLWASANRDVGILMQNRAVKNANVRQVMRAELIPTDFRPKWDLHFRTSIKRIIDSDPSFEIWADWLADAVNGKKLNFFNGDDSPDVQIKDKQASASIIGERSSQFWSRSPSTVNNEVNHWIMAAAARTSAEDGLPPEIPPQNENAISFRADNSGKIALGATLHYDALRNDEETIDRYNECVTAAVDLLNRCEGSNSAIRLTNMLRNYIDAAGSDIAALRPSLFVQRGERLRQELAAYQGHDTLLPPISDDILLDLRGWQGAHNMLVGLDPALMARDRALLGPDVRVPNAPPKEIRDFAIDADETGILAEEVIDVIIEATTLAPEIPDPTNRRTIWSFETGRNLVIEAFNLALTHPVKTTVGAAVAGTTVATLGAGGTVVSLAAGSIPAAKFLLRHRVWIETRLGDCPTWQGLFASLCDWLQNNTPLQLDKN